VFQAALHREKLVNARRLNLVRFISVSGFFSLFVILAGVLKLPTWQGNLNEFGLYWALTAGLYLGARRRDAAALLTTWAIPLIDMPMVFGLQRATFATSSDPKATAGYSIGFFIILLVLVTFSLERWRLWFSAGMASLCEGALQTAAHVEVGAIVATVLLMGITAAACGYGSDRVLSLVDRLTTDVQERKRAEERLQRMERLATIGRLAASIGHDLRNPLSAIGTAAYLLAEHLKAGTLGEADARFLEIIGREVDASSQIISKLLDMARDRPIQRVECSLRALVTEAFSLLPHRAGVALENDVSEDLGPVFVDRDLFRQVVINLAQNAAEALPEAGGAVRITAAMEAEELVVGIHDNGVGMSVATRAQLFEPLYTTKAKGTGLGLAIVQTLVEKHGGRISVESDLGKGTSFAVRVPNFPRVPAPSRSAARREAVQLAAPALASEPRK
jgi:signal transduction histidine kinase